MGTPIEYQNGSRDINKHVDKEDKQLFKVDEMATLKTSNFSKEDKTLNDSFIVNGTKGIPINESGLYSLILTQFKMIKPPSKFKTPLK